MNQATECEYDIRIVECKEFLYGGFPNDSFEGTVEIWVTFSGSAESQMGGGGLQRTW
jgi:hypothetical protein